MKRFIVFCFSCYVFNCGASNEIEAEAVCTTSREISKAIWSCYCVNIVTNAGIVVFERL